MISHKVKPNRTYKVQGHNDCGLVKFHQNRVSESVQSNHTLQAPTKPVTSPLYVLMFSASIPYALYSGGSVMGGIL